MNKGFFYYLRRSWSVTCFVYKRLSFFKKIELTLFLLVCYIGSLIFFLRPIFSIALTNAARMMEESHNLSVTKCFEGVVKNSRYKELLVAEFYVFFLALIVIALFFIIDIPFLFISNGFSKVTPYVVIPTIVIAALCNLYIELKYLPLSYVASGTINTSAGDMLLNARRIEKSAIFTEVLLIIFFFILAILVTGALVGGTFFIRINFLYSNKNIFWLIVGLYTLIPISLFFPFSLFMSMLNVALYELYKDTVSLKKVFVVKEVAGSEVGYASVFPTDKDEVELIKEEKMGGLK